MSFETWETWIEIIRNIVQIVFQGVAAYVALAGLRSWHIQLQGTTRYQVARNVVAGAYRIRDEIRWSQQTLLTPDEWAERKPSAEESDQQKKALESLFSYNRRYERIADALQKWYPDVLEAEAIFGEDIREVTSKLENCCKQYRTAIRGYHIAAYRGKKGKHTDKYFSIIEGFWDPEESEDPQSTDFTEELKSAVQGIEDFFRMYIKPKRDRTLT